MQDIDNLKEYGVAQLSNKIKIELERNFSNIKLKGEISGFKGRASSGHAYFSLKEGDAAIRAIIWSSSYSRLKTLPEEGLEVIATGYVSSYAASSNYNFIISNLELAGVGSLMARYEALKKQLTQEGLFDKKHKKDLPVMPKKIGVITASKGAVIRDILHRLRERYVQQIFVYEVLVQGTKCASQVSRAIEAFNELDDDSNMKPDLLIVARGGGSVEDLWGFNEEIVVRAAFASKIPLISAIGHETDYSLLDLVADSRAPTPTAAAEIAAPEKLNLLGLIQNYSNKLYQAQKNIIEKNKAKYQHLHRLMRSSDAIMSYFWQNYDRKIERFIYLCDKDFMKKSSQMSTIGNKLTSGLITRQILRLGDRLKANGRILASLSYKNVLARGYALVLDNEELIMRKKELEKKNSVTLRFFDGDAIVKTVKN